MRHKVNPHTLRVGVIRDWASKWNPEETITLSGDRFKNLQITSNVRIYSFNSCDVERIVKTMKKR